MIQKVFLQREYLIMDNLFRDLGKDYSLKRRVYENIKLMIVNGNLKLKQRLYEEELSKAMNVSRAPVREALGNLEKEGFVTITPRKGAIVSEINIQDVKEIYETRIVLETLAVSKSFMNIPMKELKNIESELNKLKNISKESKNRDEFILIDKKFHQLIRKYFNNSRIKKILDNFEEQIQWFNSFAYDKISIIQSVDEHLAIIDAIKKNNQQLIKEKLLQHLERSKNSLLNGIESLTK